MENKKTDGKVESIYELNRFDGRAGSEKDVSDFRAREKERKIDWLYRAFFLRPERINRLGSIDMGPLNFLGSVHNPESNKIISQREASPDEMRQYLDAQKASAVRTECELAGRKKISEIFGNKIRKYRSFSVSKYDSYPKACDSFRSSKQGPFTMEQNIEARVQASKARSGFSEIHSSELGSISGIAFKANSSKFKINPVCREFMEMPRKQKGVYLPINYDSLKAEDGWVELDRNDPEDIYDRWMTPEECKDNKAMLAMMNGNQALLDNYVDLWCDTFMPPEGDRRQFGFNVVGVREQDELRPLSLFSWERFYVDAGSLVGSVALAKGHYLDLELYR